MLAHLVVQVTAARSNSRNTDCTTHNGYRVCKLPAAPEFHHDYGSKQERNFSRPYQGRGAMLRAAQQNVSTGGEGVLTTAAATSTFTAKLTGDVTASRERAINYCLQIMSEEWESDLPVDVLVRFSHFASPYLLGMAQPTSNWEVNGFICPVALAEAVTNQQHNPGDSEESQYDILMTLNSNAPWYEGLDARPPGLTYDLVTVCLHEVYHGLFMSGGNLGIGKAADGVSYSGFVKNDEYKGRFEAFMANQDGCNIDGYVQTPLHLGTALTSNNLWFYSGADKVARLHAPKPYVSGSSWYHLSEVEYGAGASNNDLMTPVIGSSYAQHNAGALVREMQRRMLEVNDTSGATVCKVLNDPVVSDISVGGGDGAVGDGVGVGNGASGSGFVVRVGDVDVSGWVFVGAGIAAVVFVAGLVSVVRFVVVRNRRASAADSRPQRRVGVDDQVHFYDEGNGGGIV